jgi:hypothetical protein
MDGFIVKSYDTKRCHVIYEKNGWWHRNSGILEKILTRKDIQNILDKFKTDLLFRFWNKDEAQRCADYLNEKYGLMLKMLED